MAGVADEPASAPTIRPAERLLDPRARDQDDLCFWLDRDNPGRSLVIAADKKAGKLFVYDLEGKTVQAIECPEPGNIDSRFGVPLGRRTLDLVAVVDRHEHRLRLYEALAASRQLRRVDDGRIDTGENYGGTLYRSPTGRLYFFATSKTAGVSQFELVDAPGGLRGRRVRHWPLGKCEGAAADDQAGLVYIAEERRGIWKVSGRPERAGPGELVVAHGSHGLTGDVEGLAVVAGIDGSRWLLVSNQSANRFEVFRAGGDHEWLGGFAIAGALHTDGLDVLAAPLGPRFPAGLFACHSEAPGGCPVLLASWADVATALAGRPPRGGTGRGRERN
jgi:3-phytase